jgi:DNA-directed RNA polymerase specialized sigma24 family protein
MRPPRRTCERDAAYDSATCAELTEAVSAGATPEDEVERRMAMRRTLAGVAALPDRQREAVPRVAIQGRSEEEVARALGLSHGAVGQLGSQGRRALRAPGVD